MTQHPREFLYIFAALPVVLFVLWFLRGIYRITLHPLAKFPGPKITAFSRLYEAYWELFADGTGGKFMYKVEEWHRKYGPIVRINPNELHVNDPDYYNVLFNQNPKLWKRGHAIDNLIHTVSSSQHTMRRSALNNYFSRQSTEKMMYIVHERVNKLCEYYTRMRGSDQPAKASLMFRALNNDIICEYAFGKSWHFIENPEWSATYFSAISNMFKASWLHREVHIVSKIGDFLTLLPQWLFPKRGAFKEWSTWAENLRAHIETSMSGKFTGEKATDKPTIMEEYQNNKLPPDEKSPKRLFYVALMLLGAGTGTPSFAQDTALFHVLSNPDILARLKKELEEAWPDADSNPPSLAVLENLPYLRACVKESLRLVFGAMGRLQRVNPYEEMVFQDWVIPKGTPIGMTHRLMHLNEKIYPDPWKFDPERWLKGEKSKELEKYWIPFSRGSRICLGIPLAYAQVYTATAAIFRRFDMELYDTDRDCVDATLDYFAPFPKKDDLNTQRVRVLVK